MERQCVVSGRLVGEWDVPEIGISGSFAGENGLLLVIDGDGVVGEESCTAGVAELTDRE